MKINNLSVSMVFWKISIVFIVYNGIKNYWSKWNTTVDYDKNKLQEKSLLIIKTIILKKATVQKFKRVIA